MNPFDQSYNCGHAATGPRGHNFKTLKQSLPILLSFSYFSSFFMFFMQKREKACFNQHLECTSQNIQRFRQCLILFCGKNISSVMCSQAFPSQTLKPEVVKFCMYDSCVLTQTKVFQQVALKVCLLMVTVQNLEDIQAFVVFHATKLKIKVKKNSVFPNSFPRSIFILVLE